jgi:hypothetical protein
VTSVAEARRKDLVDNYFGSFPLMTKMRRNNAIKLRGGEVIQPPHIYAPFPASSYGRGSTFDTSTTEFATKMTFNWKFHYAACNLQTIDVDLNDGPEQVFDLVDAAVGNAELSLVEDMASQLFGDGTGNAGNDMDGLGIAVSRTGTYGGIARGADVQGASIRAAFEDTTGGTVSLATMNANFQTAVVGGEKPDLLVTTSTLWSRVWERSQPSERNPNPGEARSIGFDYVRFNGAAVVFDSKCTAGFMYFLNTNWWETYIHNKWDFRFRGFMEPTNQQMQIGQMIAWLEPICRSPRLQGVASGLT